MKYFMLMLFIGSVANVAAAFDQFRHQDVLYDAPKQIVRFNKNNKPHSKFFGREKVMKKRGMAFRKKSLKRG